jgi:hypothetical protein
MVKCIQWLSLMCIYFVNVYLVSSLYRYKVNLWCVYLWCVRAYGVNLYGVMVSVCMECLYGVCLYGVCGGRRWLQFKRWMGLSGLFDESFLLTHSLAHTVRWIEWRLFSKSCQIGLIRLIKMRGHLRSQSWNSLSLLPRRPEGVEPALRFIN